MANRKQMGSNLVNVEYGNGRCPTKCEQCFVNFGHKGNAQCRDLANRESGARRAFALKTARQYGLYTPPKEVPKSVKVPPGHERLAWEVTYDGEGFYNIPNKTAWDKTIISPHMAARAKFDTVAYLEQFGLLPIFLRVSSMSDAGYAPVPWVELVQDAWGDHCFFNSSIQTIRKLKNTPQREVFEIVNKIVITLNGGQQKPPPMRPAISRNKVDYLRKADNAEWQRYVAGDYSQRDTMSGKAGQKVKGDFFTPILPRDIEFKHLEQRVKFYRLRALPTMRGHMPRNVDNPVVITQMRFSSLQGVCEFARRYSLHLEVVYPSNAQSFKAARKFFGDIGNFAVDRQAKRAVVRIWTDRDDSKNASEYAGEASELRYSGNHFRPVDTDAFNADLYVCDRLHGGCAHCGLCASLDGAGTTIEGVPWSNPLNVGPGGRMMLPLPYAENAGYIGAFLPERERVLRGHAKKGRTRRVTMLPAGGDIFAEHMRDLGYPLDVPTQFAGWEQNPDEEKIDVASPERAAAIFADAGAYIEGDSGLYDDWNTHENAATAVAAAIWSLMIHAKVAGLSKREAFAWIEHVMLSSSGGIDLTDGIEDPWSMWEDESLWTDEFGPLAR